MLREIKNFEICTKGKVELETVKIIKDVKQAVIISKII